MSGSRSPEQREAYRQYNREWYARNKGKAAAYAKTYRATHPDSMRRYAISRHGITEEWYRDQLVGQAGRCAICGQVLTPGASTHIDHDHVTGKVRGLLCSNCNHLLGHAREMPRVLKAAARYLEAMGHAELTASIRQPTD